MTRYVRRHRLDAQDIPQTHSTGIIGGGGGAPSEAAAAVIRFTLSAPPGRILRRPRRVSSDGLCCVGGVFLAPEHIWGSYSTVTRGRVGGLLVVVVVVVQCM